MTIWQLINTGGIIVYILLVCSVLSVGVMFERAFYYRKKSWKSRVELMSQLRPMIQMGDIHAAMNLCKQLNTSAAMVAFAGLNLYHHTEKEIDHAMEREITIETMKLERYTNLMGTLGSTTVYIGLLGTVLGIMRAFQDISTKGAGGINVVINGISEALVCTAVGLFVAVPAVVAYNYFIKKIDTIVTDMELCHSEILDLTTVKRK